MTKYELHKEIKSKLRDITNQLGKIEIGDTSIICFINNKKLKKYLKENNNVISLNDYSNQCKHYIERLYGTYIPIEYVVQDYNFNDITLNAKGDASIYFYKCTFGGNNLDVECFKNIFFINCIFKLRESLNIGNNCLLKSENSMNLYNNSNNHIESVLFRECDFDDDELFPTVEDIYIVADNIYVDNGALCSYHDIIIKAKRFALVNTILGNRHSQGGIYISSDKLTLQKLISIGKCLKVTSPSIRAKESIFYNTDTIIINKNCDFGELYSKTSMLYNGIKISPDREYFITPESYKLLLERAKLVSALHEVNDKCNNEIKNKVRILNNKSISDTLGE